MKHSLYWKVTMGEKKFFVVENNNLKGYEILDKTIKNLPFESISNISELKKSNFHKFILDMYITESTIMEVDGTIHKSMDKKIAESIFNDKFTYLSSFTIKSY